MSAAMTFKEMEDLMWREPLTYREYLQELIETVNNSISPPLREPYPLQAIAARTSFAWDLFLNIHGVTYYFELESRVLQPTESPLSSEEELKYYNELESSILEPTARPLFLGDKQKYFPTSTLRATFEGNHSPLLFHGLGELRFNLPEEDDTEALMYVDVCVVVGINDVKEQREDNSAEEGRKPGGIYIILRQSVAGDNNLYKGDSSGFVATCGPLSFAKIADSFEDLIMRSERKEPLMLTDKYDGKVFLSMVEANQSEIPDGQ